MQIFLTYSCLLKSGLYHRYDVFLMGAGSEFRNYTSPGLMYRLSGHHLAQNTAVLEHGRSGLIARTFDP